jgi:formate--tetrahydrofolate ligase
VMPMSGHMPAAAVVIVTLKALRAQGGRPDSAVEDGFANLNRHLRNLQRWGVTPVVALNRFPGDAEADLERVRTHCVTLGVEAALSEGYARGGDGMTDLAAKVVAAACKADRSKLKPIYSADRPLDGKITDVAMQVYGAARVVFKAAARQRLQRFTELGYGALPVCIAKTQYSFTDDAKVMGAPDGWTLTVTDATLSAGAGFVVAIAGNMMLMPGMGQSPQAHKLDVDDAGNVVGMEY